MSVAMHQPAPLQHGDRVQLVAASSALLGDDALARLQAGIAVLEGWGLQVERNPLHGRQWGYLAGRDPERRGDLEAAARRGAELLACVRGGWGAARLLEQPLDLPPRWLLGFSDVTSLLWAQLAQGQGGAIHGPLVTTLAAEPAWSQERLRALLFGESLADLHGEGWCGGQAEGPLLAGNLTVATHLLGTPHLPDLRGAILVLEDVSEAPYRIERMLTHWRLSGALQQLAGIGLGQFTDCDDVVAADARPTDETSPQPPDSVCETACETQPDRFSLEQVLRERTADLGIPVVSNLPVGHGVGNAALPLGTWARLDAGSGRLHIPPT
ncbi:MULTISPECIES: LD-carboxypeptidase [Synechococcales]|uniref:S66 peptidase family protein n=1 Tax=Synechococcales TaxID=1890424 RepID=UPI000B995F01|nr:MULTISPECIES: LD-carboxypeptidase [Synechococcales]MCP9941590.1 LD-carboxypeptidase [Cyanobium sp. ATX 6E8]